MSIVIRQVSLIVVTALLASCYNSPDHAQAPKQVIRQLPQKSDGAGLYIQFCQKCHGENAQGSQEGPPLAHPVYRPDHHADAAFLNAAMHGVQQHHWEFGDMPPVQGIRPEQITSIIVYIRKLQKQAGIQ